MSNKPKKNKRKMNLTETIFFGGASGLIVLLALVSPTLAWGKSPWTAICGVMFAGLSANVLVESMGDLLEKDAD